MIRDNAQFHNIEEFLPLPDGAFEMTRYPEALRRSLVPNGVVYCDAARPVRPDDGFDSPLAGGNGGDREEPGGADERKNEVVKLRGSYRRPMASPPWALAGHLSINLRVLLLARQTSLANR